MNAIIEYITDVTHGVKTLIQGLGITIRHWGRKEVTAEYPNNRATLVMFDRFRGEVIMPHNDKNEHRCTGCGLCETACPNGSIEIITKKETDRKSTRLNSSH